MAHGVAVFDEGDYERAAALFDEAARRDPREGTPLHWLGMSYLQLGRAADALAPLEASLHAERPAAAGGERVRADLELARRLAAAGEGRPAEAELARPDDGVLLRDPLAPRRLGAEVGIAFGRDSNPGLLPEQAAQLPVAAGPAESASDSAMALGIRLDLLPLYDRDGWSLGASLAAHQVLHDRFGGLDVTSLAARLALAWGGDPRGVLAGPLGGVPVPVLARRTAFLLQAGAYDLRLGGHDYLGVVEAGASLLVRETPKTATRLDVEVRDRTFEVEATAARQRSGSEAVVGISQDLPLGRLDRRLRLGLVAGERGGGRAFASAFEGIVLGLSFPLVDRWTLLVDGTWREERFAHPESRLGGSGAKRDDTAWTAGATAVWRWSERASWRASGTYWHNASNLDFDFGGRVFDYRRTVLSTGFVWTLQ